jgi:hypothetical protein
MGGRKTTPRWAPGEGAPARRSPLVPSEYRWESTVYVPADCCRVVRSGGAVTQKPPLASTYLLSPGMGTVAELSLRGADRCGESRNSLNGGQSSSPTVAKQAFRALNRAVP